MRSPVSRLRLAVVLPLLFAPLAFVACVAAQEAHKDHQHDKAHDDKKHDDKKHDDKKHDDKKHDDKKHDDKKHDDKKHDDEEHDAMSHVLDDPKGNWHLFTTIEPKHFHLPSIFGFQITKFMVLEVIAAFLVMLFYIPLAHSVKNGTPARGWCANAFEVLLTFVRDQIAKPTLGDKHADTFVPFLWTLFLFILFNNLLGMFPFMGSATASIYVTGALALIVFFAIHGSAIVVMGSQPAHGGHGHDDHGHGHDHGDHDHAHDHGHAAPPVDRVSILLNGTVRYIQSFWPHIDLPAWGLPIKVLVFFLEAQGALIRNIVLAIRLFANMFAGHMVLATILLFIQMAANVNMLLWGTITISSVLGIVALSLLELFIAFLQAYIFTFLASLFMGMAISPQH